MNPVMTGNNPYTNTFFGIERFKIENFLKRSAHALGLRLPKLKDQKRYWNDRGDHYMGLVQEGGVLDREVFFQDLLIERLRELGFTSAFEAGCGFGWNIRRVKEEFPHSRVGGVDFSFGQLRNARRYMEGMEKRLAMGDNRAMPFADNAFDVGFSVGVYMNIHGDDIETALGELIRVSGKYIIQFEYDENHTTPELREARAFKTNIVSHDYAGLYEKLGQRVVDFRTFEDFGEAFRAHMEKVDTDYRLSTAFEGAEKYVMIVVEVQKP